MILSDFVKPNLLWSYLSWLLVRITRVYSPSWWNIGTFVLDVCYINFDVTLYCFPELSKTKTIQVNVRFSVSQTCLMLFWYRGQFFTLFVSLLWQHKMARIFVVHESRTWHLLQRDHALTWYNGLLNSTVQGAVHNVFLKRKQINRYKPDEFHSQWFSCLGHIWFCKNN